MPAEPSGAAPASGAQLLLFAFASLLLARFVARFIASYLRRIAPPPAAMAAPPPEPVMCGELTLEELRAFDGSDPSKPLYLVRRRACAGAAVWLRPARRYDGFNCAGRGRRGAGSALGSGPLAGGLRADVALSRRGARRAWATSTT